MDRRIGNRVFILDEDEIPEELEDLEYYIIDNYLDMDLDVPEELKKKYLDLKKKCMETVNA